MLYSTVAMTFWWLCAQAAVSACKLCSEGERRVFYACKKERKGKRNCTLFHQCTYGDRSLRKDDSYSNREVQMKSFAALKRDNCSECYKHSLFGRGLPQYRFIFL